MRQNLLDELTDVLDERRSINVVSPNFFMRNPATKQLKMVPSSISYGLVFDKRVIGHALFRSYHYGYTSALDDGDIQNVEAMLTLYVSFLSLYIL